MSTGVHKAAPAASHADGPRLLADVGGTNARFALETAPGEIGQIRVYPGADYPGIAEVMQQYLKDTKVGRVNHAAIAIANPADGRWIALGSEGGHATFSPFNEGEDLVMRYARRKWPHVSFERVAAGPGLELIYRAFAERDDVAVAEDFSSADVTLRAHAGE